MKLKANKIISMDFGSRNIKIVEGIFKRGKLNIQDTFLLDLPVGIYENGYIKDENDLREIIDSFFKRNNIKSNETRVVVNSSDILTREIVLPNLEIEEIEGILNYTITDYIPIEPSDYIVQYINQGVFMEEDSEKVRLFIVAIPKSIVEQHFHLLKDLNLNPRVLDFHGNAVRKLLSLDETINKNPSIKEKTIASIDIGFASTKLTILKNKNIELYRMIDLGINDMLETVDTKVDLTQREILKSIINSKDGNDESLTEKENLEIATSLNSFLSRLLNSLEMVFRYYNSEDQSNEIDLIVMQGDLISTDEMIEKLQNYLNIKMLNITSLIETIDKNRSLYSNAMGALIRGENK